MNKVSFKITSLDLARVLQRLSQSAVKASRVRRGKSNRRKRRTGK